MSASVSFRFYNSLIRYFLPLEARYVSLRGSKENTLITNIVSFYFNDILPNHNQEICEEKYRQNYGQKLDRIFSNVYQEYIGLLLDLLKKEGVLLSHNDQTVISNFYKLRDYRSVIDILEDKLSLNTLESTHNPLVSQAVHINDEIYKSEYEKIGKYLTLFQKIFPYLDNKVSTQKNPAESAEYTPLEYLLFIVSHEFLSFLSHYSTAIVYFDSPTVFSSNLNRSIAHLKRALMDIYDGLIVEENLSKNTEYLRLRSHKINVLGNSDRMNDLVMKLEEFYTENSNEYKAYLASLTLPSS